MMRFLGLAVTLGFIFIGWRIEQSILNPLINKQKRKSLMRNVKQNYKKDKEIKEGLIDGESDDDQKPKSPSYMNRYSYNSQNNSRSPSQNASAINDDTQANIKSKKKQLSIMWFIIYVILFIGFYEMIYSAIQRILTKRSCNALVGIDYLDAILLFASRFIGLILWSWPLIYVYWLRGYINEWRIKKKGGIDDDDDYDYKDPTYDFHKEGDIPRFIKRKQNLSGNITNSNADNNIDDDSKDKES